MVTVVNFNGVTLGFHVRNERNILNTDQLVISEAFTENTYDLHEDHFKHTGIFIDIGANIGAVSLLAWVLGAKRIEAYEPESENYKLLGKNVAQNGALSSVSLYRQAVWSSEKEIPLVPRQGGSTSEQSVIDMNQSGVIWVPAVTLAQVLAPFSEVDVVKIDTEGAEYEILIDREVHQKIRHLVLEYHTTTTEKFGAMLAMLSLTHNLQVFGHYDTDGGQIVAKRYGD